jgi:hypothetical protein
MRLLLTAAFIAASLPAWSQPLPKNPDKWTLEQAISVAEQYGPSCDEGVQDACAKFDAATERMEKLGHPWWDITERGPVE